MSEHNLGRYRSFSGSESHHTILYRARTSRDLPERAVADIEVLVEDYQDLISEHEDQIDEYVEDYHKIEEENGELATQIESLEEKLSSKDEEIEAANQRTEDVYEHISDQLNSKDDMKQFLLVWDCLRVLHDLIHWVKVEQAIKAYNEMMAFQASRAEDKLRNQQKRLNNNKRNRKLTRIK